MTKLTEEQKKIIFESIQELKKVLNKAHVNKGPGGQVSCICGKTQSSKACSGLKFIKDALNYPECKEMAEYIGKSCL